MNKLSSLDLLRTALVITVLSAALSAQPPTPAGPVVPAAPKGLLSPPTTDVDTSYLHYTYNGDKYRDPFLPITGSTLSNDLERPPQIGSLQLKGIIEDSRGRMALLVTGMDSFILKNGRLYDGRNRPVKGISGVIKPQSVVLIGSDRTVRELRVKTAL